MCDGAVRGMTLRRIRPEMYNWWNGLRQVFMQQGGPAGAVLSVTCLTKREREIIDCIRNHVLRSELCDKLFITENTLNKHFDNIYKKLNINSYEELLQLIKKR